MEIQWWKKGRCAVRWNLPSSRSIPDPYKVTCADFFSPFTCQAQLCQSSRMAGHRLSQVIIPKENKENISFAWATEHGGRLAPGFWVRSNTSPSCPTPQPGTTSLARGRAGAGVRLRRGVKVFHGWCLHGLQRKVMSLWWQQEWLVKPAGSPWAWNVQICQSKRSKCYL